jgi:hypothetical protein
MVRSTVRRSRTQTAQRRTVETPPHELRTSVPTYKDRRAAGGDRGPRTPDERAFIVKDFIHHLFTGCALEPPQWFKTRFLVYPAYKFTAWEISCVNCEPGFITRAKFAEYCRCTQWKDREAEWIEVAAYGAVEAALATLPGYLFDSLLFTLEVKSETDWESDSEIRV